MPRGTEAGLTLRRIKTATIPEKQMWPSFTQPDLPRAYLSGTV